MAAQAKPSQSFDSPLTTGNGGGSFFASQPTGASASGGSSGIASASGLLAGTCSAGVASSAIPAVIASGAQGTGSGSSALPRSDEAELAARAVSADCLADVADTVPASLPLGLYVHVPFCSSTCDFCAFYQEKPKRQSIDLYLEAVEAELLQVRNEILCGIPWLWQGEQSFPALAPASANTADGGTETGATPEPAKLPKLAFTVFFGGGTPGLLPPEDLGRLCGMVRQMLGEFGEIVEWSIELAPATVRPERVKVLLEHGVNRFSLGVQSFSDELLEGLGRQHSRKQIFAAFETLRAGGAKNINCDLMFALPGQTREAWLTDLQTLADLGPEHISTYCLTFEEDTAMWVKLSQGRYKLDPEREADLYRETWAWLANAGYAQYEVSNFARAGYRSRHNIGTWSMGRWRGVGPSAASQWGGWRFQNPANLEGWAGAVLAVARRAQQGASNESMQQSASSEGTQDAVAATESEACSPSCGCASESAASPQLSAVHSMPSSPQAGSVSLAARALAARAHGVKLSQFPPVQTEERVALTNRLLAADALIFGLRRRDGVNRAQWLSRFAGVEPLAQSAIAADSSSDASPDATAESTTALPLAELEELFGRFNKEGLLDVAALGAGVWRLNDEGLLLADAVGGQLLECFEAE